MQGGKKVIFLFYMQIKMRLDRFLCKSSELTMREAKQCINAGEVCVNNILTTNEAAQVHKSNKVSLHNITLIARDFRYILMHKPTGTICSNIDEAYPSLFNYLEIDRPSELHIAGRLDADTSGLVLITDDGHWSFNITQPAKKCSKVYRVSLSKPLANDVISKFEKGLLLQGEQNLTQPATLKLLGPKVVLLTITQGKFHQVKRMFAAVGNRVTSLHREQIGQVCLDVERGQWRYLKDAEINSFMN